MSARGRMRGVGGVAAALAMAACSGKSTPQEGALDASVGADGAVATTLAQAPRASSLRLHSGTNFLDGDFAGDRPTLRAGATRWTMALAASGRGEAMRVAETAPATRDGDRVVYARGAGVREWFASVPRGLEQGFTIDTRASGTGALDLDVAFDGVTPRLAGDRVALIDASGTTRAWYAELSAKDANGAEIPAHFTIGQEAHVHLVVDDRAATYPIEIDPVSYGAATELNPDTGSPIGYGTSVAVSGNVAVVGGPATSGTSSTVDGAVAIYVNSGGSWALQYQTSLGSIGDGFGAAVATNGSIVLVGAPFANGGTGAVYLFTASGTKWIGSTVPTLGAGQSIGAAIAIDAQNAVIGAPGGAGEKGYVYFLPVTSATTLGAGIPQSDPSGFTGDGFGAAVAIDSTVNTALVGAPGNKAVYVYNSSGTGTSTTWSGGSVQLKAGAPSANVGYGGAVAISGANALVGFNTRWVSGSIPTTTPYVWAFSLVGGTWTQPSSFSAPGATSVGDAFGSSVALVGTNGVIGDSAYNGAGAAFYYAGTSTTSAGVTTLSWPSAPTTPLLPSTFSSGDAVGASVAMSGAAVLVGSPGANSSQGVAYLFEPSTGAPCTSPADCASGNCADGYCCDQPCTGQCQACDVAGALGTCTAVPAGTPPHGTTRAACAGSGPCIGTCDGTSTTACTLPAQGLVCGDASCTSAGAVTVAACNGSGSCSSTVSFSCSPYGCAPACTPRSCTSVGASCGIVGDGCGGLINCGACTSGTTCGGGGTPFKCGAPTGSGTTCSPSTCASQGIFCGTTTDGCGNTIACGTCPVGQTCGGGGNVGKCAAPCNTTCSAASDCATGYTCSGSMCVTAGAAQGSACTATAACQSGLTCVDGYCCNSACGGQCQACDVTPGTCTTVASGQPHGSRAKCGGTGVCQATCDGSSATTCGAYPTSSKSCTAESCSAGSNTSATTCNGAGACTSATVTSCSPYICSSATGPCKTACTADTDCIAGDYCASNVCKPKLTNGTTATVPTQCASGIIADGVCCATTCADICDACNVSGKAGTCSPVSGTPASGHGTCTNAGATCGGACDGTQTTTCSYPTTTATCGNATCTSGAQTAIGKCDGVGDCVAGSVTPCGAFACGASACKTACTADSDCAVGNYCAAPNCLPKLANGATATGADQCTSGFVADGVCCDSACNDACDACNLTGHVGTCSAVGTGSHATGHPACTSDGSVCAGSCDGFSKTTCAYPNTSTACGAASCSGGVEKLVPMCDGAGHCPAATTKACSPFLCGATACSTTCSTNADCVSGQACNPATHACGTPQANGASCTTASICASGFCANGVCCDGACTDGCDSCNQPTHVGTCTALPKGSAGTGCGAAVCNGTSTSCPTTCATDTDCGAGAFCDPTSLMCLTKYDPGSPATGANQCASGIVADGVCCATTCTGVCQSCAIPGSAGTCKLVTGAPASGHGSCAGSASACNGTCDGTAPTCSFPTSSVACGSATCSGGQRVGAPACDGAGNCAAPAPTSCNDYACASGACKTTCATDADCATGKVCGPGGVCGGPLSNGNACSTGADCSSTNCVDGVCCDSKCTGTCTACTHALTGQTTGTCANITAGTDPLAQCAAPSCSAGVAKTNACNGSGACAATTTACGAAGCSGTTCATPIDAGTDSTADTSDSGTTADATAGDAADAIVTDATAEEATADEGTDVAVSEGATEDTAADTSTEDALDADAGSDATIADAAPSDAGTDANVGDAQTAVCTNFGDPCGDAMSCNSQLQCVPGSPLLPGCGCSVPGQQSDAPTTGYAVGAIAIALGAIGKRRLRRR